MIGFANAIYSKSEHDKGEYYGEGRKIRGIYIPTLSELIDACGDGFYGLRVWMIGFDKDENEINGYQAMDNWHNQEEHNNDIGVGLGKTPEEAVANLYLKLKELSNSIKYSK